MPSQRVDPWVAEPHKGYFDASCIITRSLTLLLLHAFYDLFTSFQLRNDLARCFTTLSTVSTLQDCNFTSLSLKAFYLGPTLPAGCSQRPLFQIWIALACIQIRFFAGIYQGSASSNVLAKHAKNEKRKGMDGKEWRRWECIFVRWSERLVIAEMYLAWSIINSQAFAECWLER